MTRPFRILTLYVTAILVTAGCGSSQVVARAITQNVQPEVAPGENASERITTSQEGPMDLERMDSLIRATADQVDRQGGAWRFSVGEVDLMCITDTDFDRMRIVAPIVAVDDMDDGHRAAVLNANFHTALDARYATNDGILYGAFIHPLTPLTDAQVTDAIHQVVSLVRTYGSSYTSVDLTFGL